MFLCLWVLSVSYLVVVQQYSKLKMFGIWMITDESNLKIIFYSFIFFLSLSFFCSSLISVPPRWRIEPTDVTVVKGRNAIIDCDTDAYPEPVITWSRAEGIFFPFLLFCTENFHSFFFYHS